MNICPDCKEECTVIPLDNSFSYSGTHCNNGRSGVHKPEGYGMPVSDCCEAESDDYELERPEPDNCDWNCPW